MPPMGPNETRLRVHKCCPTLPSLPPPLVLSTKGVASELYTVHETYLRTAATINGKLDRLMAQLDHTKDREERQSLEAEAAKWRQALHDASLAYILSKRGIMAVDGPVALRIRAAEAKAARVPQP